MSEILDLTVGLQCCLRCGRLLTNRALHDAIEEPVLASIRAGHPEWTGTDEVCAPCLSEYHTLLSGRQTRSARWLREREQRRWLFRLGRWFERRFSAGQA